MKTCIRCNEYKDNSEFYVHRGAVKGECKACRKIRVKDSREKSRARSREFVKQYLKDHPCVDCGNTDVRVLQFDHVIPLMSNKKRRVANLYDSPVRLMEEVSKCEVRCANCHMIRTAGQFGWSRDDW